MLYINKYSTYSSSNWKAVLTAFIQLPTPLTPTPTFILFYFLFFFYPHL